MKGIKPHMCTEYVIIASVVDWRRMAVEAKHSYSCLYAHTGGPRHQYQRAPFLVLNAKEICIPENSGLKAPQWCTRTLITSFAATRTNRNT